MKILVKICYVFIMMLALFLMTGIKCYADEALFEKEVFGSLPDEVLDLYEDIGVDSLNFDSVFNVSGSDILELIKKLVTGAVESPLISVVRLIAAVIIIAVFECFLPDDSKIKDVMNLAGALFCVLSIIKPLTFAVTSSVSAISVSGKFMLVLIPVLTGVVSASGNPTLAVSFQSIAFVAAQLIALFATQVIVPVVGVILSLDIVGSLIPGFSLSSFTDAIKKSITTVLSFCATVFVSFLGLKAGMANTADTLMGKGMKLVISSAVPVIGGALSEAYSGVVGSMMLVKSTIGVFGIGAIALITLPSCLQLLVWILALKISSGIAAMFEQRQISDLLKAVSSSLVLLNVTVVFVAVLFIISTSLILVLKAG